MLNSKKDPDYRKVKKPKCRCYINSKFYARAAKQGSGSIRGYIPCPIHERDDCD